MGVLGVLVLIVVGLILSVNGDVSALKPGHYAIGGVAILPTMLSVLALIVMESDAVHKANTCILPDAFLTLYPDNQPSRQDV